MKWLMHYPRAEFSLWTDLYIFSIKLMKSRHAYAQFAWMQIFDP